MQVLKLCKLTYKPHPHYCFDMFFLKCHISCSAIFKQLKVASASEPAISDKQWLQKLILFDQGLRLSNLKVDTTKPRVSKRYFNPNAFNL